MNPAHMQDENLSFVITVIHAYVAAANRHSCGCTPDSIAEYSTTLEHPIIAQLVLCETDHSSH
jgi:hypothetical protein